MTRSAGPSGFTLLEVLLALTILAFIALGTFSSTRQMLAAKEDIDYRTEVVQMQRAVFALLERDLKLAFHQVPADFIWEPVDRKTDDSGGGQDDPSIPPAVPPPVVTLFRGRSNEIFFATKSHQRMSVDSPENEQHFVTYQIADNALVRAETTRAITLSDREEQDRFKKIILIPNVERIQFKYWDPRPERWQDSWDTEKNETQDILPTAVEIELVYTPDVDETARRKPEKTTLKTAFVLTEPLFRKPGAGVAPKPAPTQPADQGGGPNPGPSPGPSPNPGEPRA